MTIAEAINSTDALKHNTYTQAEKISWLSALDGRIKKEIVDTHEGGEGILFTGYDEETDTDTALLVPAPYDELYLLFLESKIDYYNGEIERYNNSVTTFNTAYSAFERAYNRANMPICCQSKYF